MFTSAFRMAMTAGFTPRSLDPLVWLDGADSSSLYDATSGGSLVSADGIIARWQDKSGNSNHLTQATSGARPTRRVGVKNGADIVRFNGANELNTASNVLFASCPAITHFIVMNLSTPGIIIESSPNFNLTVGAFITSSDTGNVFGSAFKHSAGYATCAEVTGSTNAWHNWATMMNPTLAIDEVSFFRDGNTPAVTRTFNSDTTTSFISERLFLGARSGGLIPATGDIAEVLIYPRALSVSERQSVERYLSAKWGIPIA